jgi:hypothetical protein
MPSNPGRLAMTSRRKQRHRNRIARVLLRYPTAGLYASDVLRLAFAVGRYDLLIMMEADGLVVLEPKAGEPLAPDCRIRCYPTTKLGAAMLVGTE